MRAAIYLNSPDEGSVGLVHYDVSRPDFFQDLLIHIAIVGVYDHQVVHLKELEIIPHTVEAIENNVFFLRGIGFRELYLGHQVRNLPIFVLRALHVAIDRPSATSSSSRAASYSTALVRGCSASVSSRTPSLVRETLKCFFVLREKGRTDPGELLSPIEIVP